MASGDEGGIPADMEKVKIKILGVNLFPMMRKFMQMKSESSRKKTVLKQVEHTLTKRIIN